MSNITEKNYTVEKTLDYDEYLEKEFNYSHSLTYYETDVFNKASRTTVCLDGAYGARVMYCENCDETHYNQMGIEVELRKYNNENQISDNISNFNPLQLHMTKVICKKCGSLYNLEDVRIIEHFSNANDSSVRAVYDTIYNDDGLVKLSIKFCSMVAERAFYSVDNKYKIIFNTKTGQTYLYNNPQNKKNKVQPIAFRMSLENIYLSSREFDILFERCLFDTKNQKEYRINKIKEIYNLIYENICNNLGYKPKTLEEYAQEFNLFKEEQIYSFKALALYNRFPNLNPFGIIKFNQENTLKIQLFKRMRKIKNTSKNPLLEFANLYKIKHFDLFEKYFYKKPEKIGLVIYFSMFFKDKKYLESIVDIYENKEYFCYSPSDINILINNRYSLDNSISLFFKEIRKSINEHNLYLIVKKFITDYNFKGAFNDLSDLYYILKQVNNKFKPNMQYVSNILCGVINGKSTEEIVKNIQDYLYEESYKASCLKNKKLFKFKLISVSDYYKNMKIECNKNNFLISTIYDNVPHFNPYILKEMFFYGDYYETNIIKYRYELMQNFDICSYISKDNNDVLGELFRKFEIPNVKSLRVKILRQPKLFSALIFYNKLFKDINALNNILDSFEPENGLNFGYSFKEVNSYLFNNSEDKYSWLRIDNLYKITKCLIDTFGESISAKKIIGAYKKNSEREIEDIWSLYELYTRLYPGQSVDLTGNIKEIHDRLIGLTGGYHNPFTEEDFEPFIYTKQENELNCEIEEYSFNLVYDGRELAILGNDLKNCVRSYSRQAREKSCLIVSVIYNNNYKICIELTPANKSNLSYEEDYNYLLKQAKLFANTPVSRDSESLSVVLEWMKANKIKDCSTDIESDTNLYLPNIELFEAVPF